MHEIYEIALQTPWWVYLLFIYLIKIGVKASAENVVSMKKLAVLPILFSVMSVHTLLVSFQITGTVIFVWAGSIIIGMVIGWMLVRDMVAKVDKKKWLIQLPGTWSTLILVLITFASKYYFGYELAADPGLVHQSMFEYSLLLVSGACTGLFVGRFLTYLSKFKQSQSVDLFEDDEQSRNIQ